MQRFGVIKSSRHLGTRLGNPTMTATTTKTIVMVEDESAIIDLVAHLLQASQLEIIPCQTGPHGLATIFDRHPDMVILDVMLPGINGWKIYDQVRNDENLKHTPILMLSVTQRDEFERRENFGRNNIDAYLTKPFDTATLRRTVQEMLGVNIW
jgi:DNA-binding response OmpR family regulator